MFVVFRLVGVPVQGWRSSSVQVLAEFFGFDSVYVSVIDHGLRLQVSEAIAVRVGVGCASGAPGGVRVDRRALLFDRKPWHLFGKGFAVVDVAEFLVYEEILYVFRGIRIQDFFSDIGLASELPAAIFQV